MTDDRDEHIENAPISTDLQLYGMINDGPRFVLVVNAATPMNSRESGNVMLDRELNSKALGPMLTRVSGNVMLSSVYLSNANSQIVLIPVPIETLVSSLTTAVHDRHLQKWTVEEHNIITCYK